MSQQDAVAQGVIRCEEVPFLPQYGTAYVLYDLPAVVSAVPLANLLESPTVEVRLA